MNVPILRYASLPSPAGSLSPTTFVARFLLVSMAIVAAIVLIVTAPPVVTVPLGLVFIAYLFGTLAVSTAERLRRRGRDRARSRDARDNALSAWD